MKDTFSQLQARFTGLSPFKNSTAVRYVLAFLIMLAAFGLRLALTPIMGSNIPYITIFPAMTYIAVKLGAGPAVASTCLGILLGEHVLVEPWGIVWDWGLAARVVIMLGTGFYVGWVSQGLRRARADAEREMERAVLAEQALRQQVELIDPARAEVIAQEMQRVMRTRMNKSAAFTTSTADFLWKVPTYAGILTAGIGVVVLLGWVLDIELLKTAIPGMISMRVNTALCLILAGLALVFRQRRVLVQICAGIICALAGLTLIEYVFHADLHIDQLLRVDSDSFSAHPGRMSQAAVAGFLLSAASLFLLASGNPRFRGLQQALAICTGLIGLIGMLGYLNNVQVFYSFAIFSNIAVHTAVSFLLLSLGLLLAAPEGVIKTLTKAGPAAQLGHRLLPVAVLLPIVLGWLVVWGARHQFYGAGFDLTLLTLAMIISLVALVWWTVKTLDISDNVRRETEAMMHIQTDAMDRARDALIIREMGGTILTWNRGAEELYGWSAAEAVGREEDTLLETDPVKAERFRAKLSKDGRWQGELLRKTRDGSGVIVECRKSAVRTDVGRVLVLESDRDVTERKQAEEALRRSETRFRAIFETVGVGIMELEGKDNIVAVNDTFCRIVGRTRDQLLQMNVHDLTWPEDQPLSDRLNSELHAGARDMIDYEKRYIRGDGTPIWARVIVSPIRDRDGHWVRSTTTITDITSRKQAEEDQKRLIDNLARSNRDLQQFAYVASHDLQEPLRQVSSFTQLLASRYSERLDKEAWEYMDFIVEGSKRMQNLIFDLLQYSRADSAGRKLALVALNEALEQALHNLSVVIEENQATITHDDLPTVEADKSQLVQVFQNLISNAIKFRTEVNPVIHVGVERKEHEWLFSVRDNGIGFPQEQANKIFQLFQRLHARQRYEGTGIGLAICKRAIERHGGQMYAQSEPGQGSVFYFTLPATE